MKKMVNVSSTLNKIIMGSVATSIMLVSNAYAENLGTMASTVKSTFENVGLATTALAYVAGLGFAISAILKFKAHKDNPSQTPIGQPISQMLIAAGLLFMPTVFQSVGNTFFKAPDNCGPSGCEIGGSSSS